MESVNALLFETVKVYGTCIGNEAIVHSAGKGEGGKNNIQKMALKFKTLNLFQLWNLWLIDNAWCIIYFV